MNMRKKQGVPLLWRYMGGMVPQITGDLTICLITCSDLQQENVRAPHYWPYTLDSLTKGQ